MSGNIITFISNNAKGIQTSQKRMKLFEYLRSYKTLNRFFSFREHIRQLMMKRNGKRNSRTSFFSLTVKQIHAEFQLAIMEP